jgi:hypothetical protein
MGNFKVEIDNKRAIKKLEDMEKNVKKLDGERRVPVSEIFNPSFMSKYTIYSSFDDMLSKSGLLEKYGDFKSIDDKEWELFIKKNTNFSNWEEMQSEARRIWIKNQIGI